ncbi:hypothetical protein SARC_09061 [Sphaeroforma arctica JP610]|uniref:OTU domain-containing protein n=1 Tax=Sphaeroforma arctica JP610 TaxID=667725 RepID=A0A0L0FPS7_9EUKA|nr:hypothetical protein SARC_09061 [Sphaeroforma arctica JP610]KNC78516.1 hypothetical protein SARC_09061 [Sphaeroforma arctica JP610]|eukprot:XP_014152418.1 hypothetical protein SARC_09061 [Sphaeroforma arctica JP610]
MVANTSAVNNPAPDHGKKEDEAFRLKLKPLGIQIQPIPADGDCLYAAIADQLERHSRTVNGEVPTAALIRALAANHMRNSRDDFLPFCLNEDGDMVDSSGFDRYCQSVEHSKQWGGQLELRALAEALQTTVIVYQARSNEMPIEIPNSQEEPLLVSYHQHSYTLGAHYNSLLQTT